MNVLRLKELGDPMSRQRHGYLLYFQDLHVRFFEKGNTMLEPFAASSFKMVHVYLF